MNSCLHSLCSPHAQTTPCHMIFVSKCSGAIILYSRVRSEGSESGFECNVGSAECYVHRVAAASQYYIQQCSESVHCLQVCKGIGGGGSAAEDEDDGVCIPCHEHLVVKSLLPIQL